MGGQNGCCATPCSFKPEEMANAITIWGDLFNQDTRALLIICEMAGAPHRFKLVDTFAKQNLEPEYEQMNPNRSIPIITQKDKKVIGGLASLYLYTKNANLNIAIKFYSDEQALDIKNMMGWFSKVMRKTTQRLIAAICDKKVFNITPSKPPSIDSDLKEFHHTVMSKLEEKLVEKRYMTGQ